MSNAKGPHKRRLEDIKFTADLTKDELVSIWGKPDGGRGSGIDYIEYTLEDGREVWVNFLPEPPYRLNIALLCPPTGKPETLFSR